MIKFEFENHCLCLRDGAVVRRRHRQKKSHFVAFGLEIELVYDYNFHIVLNTLRQSIRNDKQRSIRRKHTKLVIVSWNMSNNSWNHCYKWPIVNGISHKLIVNKPFNHIYQFDGNFYHFYILFVDDNIGRMHVNHWTKSWDCESVQLKLIHKIFSISIEIDWVKRIGTIKTKMYISNENKKRKENKKLGKILWSK